MFESMDDWKARRLWRENRWGSWLNRTVNKCRSRARRLTRFAERPAWRPWRNWGSLKYGRNVWKPQRETIRARVRRNPKKGLRWTPPFRGVVC